MSYAELQDSKAVGYFHMVEVGSSNLPSPNIIPYVVENYRKSGVLI